MKKSKKLLAVLCLLTLASCGGSGGGSSSSGDEDERQEMQESEGKYKAIIRPVNITIAGWTPSAVTDIKITGDMVEVSGWMDDSAAVTHMQSIHVGTKCPEMEHDANKDGYVDFNETLKVSKRVLIPLDGNLNSQTEGAMIYPNGNYTYFQKASLADMMNDLTQADLDRNDHVAKLSAGEGLNLEGRVIVVMGVAANRTLPATVSTINGQTPQASIPIACGVIQRME